MVPGVGAGVHMLHSAAPLDSTGSCALNSWHQTTTEQSVNASTCTYVQDGDALTQPRTRT